MDTKRLGRVQIKDADKGQVEAVFATIGVRDLDHDVTRAGAFTDGAPVRISSYNHSSWGGALPVGKGSIRVEGDEAILDGQFFMNTAGGRDTFETVKEMGELQEWSYGFDINEFAFGEDEGGQRVRFLDKLTVHEVSPVLLGAGVGTRTLAAKAHRTFSEEAEAVLAAVDLLNTRAADVLAKRLEKGKGLGAESSALLERLQAELKRLEAVLAPPAPVPSDTTAADAQREFLRFAAHAKE